MFDGLQRIIEQIQGWMPEALTYYRPAK